MKSTYKMTIVAVGLIAVTSAAMNVSAAWRGDPENCPRAAAGQMLNNSGQPGRGVQRQLDLDATQAKKLVEARLIMRGNDRLKVGDVEQKDENTYLVDILTVDNSLVRQVEVDRHAGLPRRGMMAGR